MPKSMRSLISRCTLFQEVIYYDVNVGLTHPSTNKGIYYFKKINHNSKDEQRKMAWRFGRSQLEIVRVGWWVDKKIFEKEREDKKHTRKIGTILQTMPPKIQGRSQWERRHPSPQKKNRNTTEIMREIISVLPRMVAE